MYNIKDISINVRRKYYLFSAISEKERSKQSSACEGSWHIVSCKEFCNNNPEKNIAITQLIDKKEKMFRADKNFG